MRSGVFLIKLFAQQQENISSVFSSDSEAKVSELLEYLKEMFPMYYMQIIYSTGSNLQ